VNEGGPASLIQLDSTPSLEEEIPLSANALRALTRWRARHGEIFTAVDPIGSFYRIRLTALEANGGRAIAFERLPVPSESRARIEIYQALPEKERFELILQKLTELGVMRIVPFISRRSTTLEERDAVQKKSHRWPEVILRAARQCRRAMLPELFPVMDWDSASYLASSADLRLMLLEKEATWTLKEALSGEHPARSALLVGPEGGFHSSEVEDARNMGFLPVSLGPRILRTETAAIAASAILQYAVGDLG